MLIYILIIIQAIICGIFCVTIAGSKNRDTFAWGVLGFLFGIIALIAIAGMPPLKKSLSTTSDFNNRNSKQLRCANCGKQLKFASAYYRVEGKKYCYDCYQKIFDN